MNRGSTDLEDAPSACGPRFAREEARAESDNAMSETSKPPVPGPAPASAHAGPAVRGESVLRRMESGFARFDRALDRFIPDHMNPLARTGAIANTCFLIAAATGVVLLFWYSPSVYKAYDSLEALREGSFLGQLMRSLHRYSSDACMLFILLHVVRVFVARKFTGARSLAWITGIFIVGILWVIGWTGYWLVWDERAQQVALGSAKLFDVLPIFGDPLSRSFLTNELVPSLFFFLVFFVHMLLPLGIVVMLWLHLSRISRPKLFTGHWLTGWILVSLVVLSLVVPAESAGRADLAVKPDGFGMDWWYLWPLVLTDRFGGGALWALFFVGTIVLCAVPRMMVKRSETIIGPARVNSDTCQGCTLCSKDCPFDAIRMVSRDSEGKGPKLMAQVDPNRCVSCGICTGACDSDAIALPGLAVAEEKASIDHWIRRRQANGEEVFLAYVCGQSGGDVLAVNPVTLESPALPGYRVMMVPCAGWVSAALIEHAIQAGAPGVLIVGCCSGEAVYREGADWLEQRLDGKRKPILRPGKADRNRVLFLRTDRMRMDEVSRAAAAFKENMAKTVPSKRNRLVAIGVGVLLAGLSAFVTWAASDAPYRGPSQTPELYVSFSHLGEPLEEARRLTDEELERLPVHMRAETGSGGSRAPVRLRLSIDGDVLLEREYRPRGLRRDGPSTALENLELPEGTYRVHVRINDTADPDAWPFEWEETFELSPGDRRVVLFDGEGFQLH